MERASKRLALPMLVVASLLIISIGVLQSWRGWRMAMNEARGRTQNQVSMVEYNARQVLVRIRGLLVRAGSEVTRGRTESAAIMQRRLETMFPDDGLVQSLFVLDRYGKVLATTETDWEERNKSHAGMDYFSRHAGSGADRELVFGSPKTMGVDGAVLLPVSRRVSDARGAFVGVVVAMVRASYFQQLYDSAAENEKGAVSLFSTSGDVWGESHSDEPEMQPWTGNRDEFQRQVFSWPTGTVTGFAMKTGAKWVFSHRTMSEFPFVVTYGLPHSVVLSSWKSTVTQDALLLLFSFTALAIVMAKLDRNTRLHRQARSLLEKSELLFKNLTENIPDGIVRVDTKCRHLFLNAAAMRIARLEGQHPLGRTLEEIFPQQSEVFQPLRASVQRAIDQAIPDECEFVWPNGQIMEVRHLPEFDAEGCVVSVLGIARDITTKRRTELILAQRERQFRTLADSLPDCVCRYDTAGREVYKNAAMSLAFGDAAPNRSGMTPSERVPLVSDFIVKFARVLERVLATGDPADFTAENDHGPSCGAIYHIRFVPERDESGSVVGAIAIGHDISELKRRERELEQSRDLLRELVVRDVTTRENERKSIAREIHDELGQVVTALRLDIATLQFQFGDNEAMSVRCGNLLKLTDATIRTVRNIVLALRPSVLEMGLVPALEWLVGDILKRNGIRCDLEVESECANMDEARLVGIFRIVQESLTNILRHADAREVAIQLKKQDEKLNLTIRDNGMGFDCSSVVGKSFGLVGIRERALMMGGWARIDSTPDQGTIVQVELSC